MEPWQQLETWICSQLQELDPYIKRSPGSGNKSCKGDIKFSTNIGLHLEAKWRNLKSVFNQEWLNKCASEIPLHTQKIPVVITEDKNGKRVAHLEAVDFFNLYNEYYKLKLGEK